MIDPSLKDGFREEGFDDGFDSGFFFGGMAIFSEKAG